MDFKINCGYIIDMVCHPWVCVEIYNKFIEFEIIKNSFIDFIIMILYQEWQLLNNIHICIILTNTKIFNLLNFKKYSKYVSQFLFNIQVLR